MPNCYAMGQAAGVAAALAVQQRKPPRGLDTGLLLETLRRQDALVEIRT
ncbi:MAG: FAD-dependent oxidoreductase [Candidatus Sericytochromatia bacterium]